MSTIDLKKLSFAGFLVSIGIVFGDIGTSPLYTYTAIIGEQKITELIALGGVSAIFWTLFFQTTVKYVFITLRADNKGEGGIFSLYTLIRKYRRWLLFPAIAGGSFLLADSIITPPISVSSAIEGLKPSVPDLPVIPIVISILILLFTIQRKGTSFIGKLFGPVMLIWFTMIGVLGVGELLGNFSVFKALNPYYAYKLLSEHPGGFWLLGGVFLCTTGAEALYSDLGHCGRKNIQISWLYVKICLILCYFGQAAWLLHHQGENLTNVSPFFGLVPHWFLYPAIIIAAMATIIASQALISGSFTLVAEAIRLNLWPKLRVVFPSDVKGQLYIPSINWFLMLGCIAVVLYFRESKNMEAAFGLSVTLTMLMTTILLSFYLYTKKVNKLSIFALLLIFLSIEGAFLVANLKKFMHGGWVTLLLGLLIFSIMYIWYRAGEIRKKLQNFVPLEPYIPVLKELSIDEQVPKYATNLVYLTSSGNSSQIEERSIYSILYKQPKRADIYWFVHIDVVDEPYKMSYKTEIIAPDDIVWVTFKLGFRIAPRINLLFRKVVEEMVKNKEVNINSRYCSLGKHNLTGDFRFVVMQRFLSFENELSLTDNFILKAYFMLKKISLPDEKEYGLDYSNVTVEKSPLILSSPKNINLVRE
ncbi:MAG: KUP/HAK/KT family potassium transporter [Bacteroidetes bacterium]|nr:KUP/HAK/KT family potassium transporter [Bacteroidota bacterium]